MWNITKLVFSNQLKSVVGRTWDEDVLTASGKEVHAMFGYTSISARIVASPQLMGTTYELLRIATREALKAYDGG